MPASLFFADSYLPARCNDLWTSAIDRPHGRLMIADLAASGLVRRHPPAALDPPHRAGSPAVPALVGSGSPLTVKPNRE